MEAVVEPLNDGIVSIYNICMSLLDAQVDPTTDTCSNYKQIRRHIKNAEWYLRKSETTIKKKLGYFDERMEQLTKEKGNVEQQKKEKCMAKDKLHIEKKSAEESLKSSEAALKQAQKNVESTKRALQKQEDRKETGGWVTAAGAGITLIPIAGWIAGEKSSTSDHYYKFAIILKSTTNHLLDAKEELEENDSKVKENRKRVSNYQSKICKIKSDIEETDKLKQHLEVTAAFQEMVRRAVNLLGILTGRVTVLERQTQRFILWQPVIKAMEDVLKAAGNVAEN
ncbi:hypothetical protein M9458_032763, partial [Cirrhinus mrigala]